ncbi:hypothetical protein [Loigolactobacillus jiayinensis]|uniref:Collagen-like protein n=1 Tax=Loigolactobacillus jiayinensis TaxID=2486016 RepID=A0ABW1RC69_9LACO|nr:hypothetical protein [Loigolactobacillus jiayinensis]
MAIDIIPLLYPNQQQFYPEVAPEAVTGLDSHLSVWATANGALIYNTVKDLIGTISGQSGADGKSAYELAVVDGFSGTEAEWLASLKGPTGATGPQGPTGKDAVSQIIDGGNSTTNGRAVNSPPSYYQTNYPAKEVREFKQTDNVGVTLVSGQTSTYGILSTRVPGTDTGFGRPRQTFEPTLSARPLTYVRIGISDTAWSDWELVTTW